MTGVQTCALPIYTVEQNVGYSLGDITILSETASSSVVSYKGETITIPLPGKFNILNALAALKLTEAINIPLSVSKKGIESLLQIRGRVEKVDCSQNFTVIVDYAHTDDSLRKLYETFTPEPVGSRLEHRLIAVLGSTGGGRDTWKRPILGKIADEFCDEIIITNEDPYDEDPMKIINEVTSGVTHHIATKIIDRREAIAHALSLARFGDTVLITGKGTDPYIMGPHGTKEAWDDANVVREELQIIKDKSPQQDQ